MTNRACPFHVGKQVAAAQQPLEVLATQVSEKPTLSAQLKARTQGVHDAAEHHGFHSSIMGPQPSLHAYAMMLGQMLHVHAVLEPILRAKAAEGGPFATLAREQYLHTDALIADLEFLGATPQMLKPLPATRRFGEKVARHAMQSPSALGLIGIFYVLEGSTNGGTIIAKRLREAHGWSDDRGTSFINPHGNQVRVAWKEWKTALDALVFDDHSQEQIIQAACDTFAMMTSVLSDLHAQLTQEPVAAKA